jgi:heat-inducible transcriptional repressor
MDLSKRQLAVLGEIVDVYIRNGTPVSSKQVAAASSLGLSPASIRNLMAELEEAGLVSRAHASAGCVPTDTSFRAYVDNLRPRRRLSARARNQLSERLAGSRRRLVEDIEWVAQLVADVTREAGVAIRPMGEERELEAVTLLPSGDDMVLGVVITTDGSVEKRVVKVEEKLSREQLVEVSNYLNSRWRQTPLSEIPEALAGDDPHLVDRPEDGPGPGRRTLAELARLLFSERADDAEVLVAGANNLLQTKDFEDSERLRSLVAVLHDRSSIVREWRRRLNSGDAQVILGRESEVTASGNLGMVATLFYRSGRQAGAVGVVGPRRMDYVRIVPVVEFIGNTLTRMLEAGGAIDA